MKKIIAIIALGIVTFFIIATPIHAQDVSAMKTATESSAYTLPYPGILADNPLYKIKLLRDKLLLSLTSDPAKKAKLYLLLADKKIAGAKLLAEKRNFPLARDSALKGENELTELTFYYKANNLKPDSTFLQALTQASLKHREVFQEIQNIVPEEEKAIYTTLDGFSKRNEEEFGLISL